MARNQKGFTLIELMIVVVIIGILAAIAIPNFIAMQNRAKEGSTKANMHTLQLAAEDYGVAYDGVYANAVAGLIDVRLPATYKNPFDGSTGANNAWETRGSMGGNPATKSGIASYCDSANNTYNIKAYGRVTPIAIVMTSGQ